MPNSGTADLNGRISQPVPTNINATPNAKLRIHWVTGDTNTSNAVKFTVKAFDVIFNTTSVDGAFDETLTVTDQSNGQYVENECEVALSVTSITSGKGVRFLVTRDPADASDTLGADVLITEVLLVADI